MTKLMILGGVAAFVLLTVGILTSLPGPGRQQCEFPALSERPLCAGRGRDRCGSAAAGRPEQRAEGHAQDRHDHRAGLGASAQRQRAERSDGPFRGLAPVANDGQLQPGRADPGRAVVLTVWRLRCGESSGRPEVSPRFFFTETFESAERMHYIDQNPFITNNPQACTHEHHRIVDLAGPTPTAAASISVRSSVVISVSNRFRPPHGF